MIVKLDLFNFTGHADLTGNELDALSKILGKFFGTDQRYLDSRYVEVRTRTEVKAKMEITTGVEFMSQSNYEIEKGASDARAAAIAENQRIERADLAAEIFGGSTGDDTKAKLDDLLGNRQSLLYWRERNERNPFVGPYVTDTGIYFYVGENNGTKITLGLDGKFSREEV